MIQAHNIDPEALEAYVRSLEKVLIKIKNGKLKTPKWEKETAIRLQEEAIKVLKDYMKQFRKDFFKQFPNLPKNLSFLNTFKKYSDALYKKDEKTKKAPEKKPKVELKTTIPIKVQQSTMGNLKPAPKRQAPKRPKEEKKKLTAKEASDKLQGLDKLPKREAKKVLVEILSSQSKTFWDNKLHMHILKTITKNSDDILKKFGIGIGKEEERKEEKKEEPKKRTLTLPQAVSIIKNLGKRGIGPGIVAKRRNDLLRLLTAFKDDKKFYATYKKDIDRRNVLVVCKICTVLHT